MRLSHFMNDMKFETPEKLAKYVIDKFVKEGIKSDIPEDNIAKTLKRKAACFVTVYVDGNLRGCIGNAVATGPLWKSVTDNAVFAVSEDYRFLQIKKDELRNLTLEVSVLTPLSEYKPKSPADLLQFLEHEKPGLMLSKYGRKALFLPQVWEDLPKPEEFLSHLCLKAGLDSDDWKEGMSFRIFGREED
jgi:AmmeMemoRadiSam system protein A